MLVTIAFQNHFYKVCFFCSGLIPKKIALSCRLKETEYNGVSCMERSPKREPDSNDISPLPFSAVLRIVGRNDNMVLWNLNCASSNLEAIKNDRPCVLLCRCHMCQLINSNTPLFQLIHSLLLLCLNSRNDNSINNVCNKATTA